MWPFKKGRAARAHSIEIDEFLHDEDAPLLREALEDRNWEIARKILSTANKEHFMYYVGIAAATRGVEEWIAEPVRDEPSSTLPLLIRGARMIYWAWDARGTGTADTVSQETWKVWFQRLKTAENCLDEVLDRDPGCAEAWHYLVMLGRARQLPVEETWRRFHKLIEIDPSHFFGHEQMYQALMPKWGGSQEALLDFARTRAAACPATHVPVLVARAHLDSRWDNGGLKYLRQEQVAAEIYAAAHESFWHDDYETTLLTPVVWNYFAFALTYGRYFRQACDIFDSIGDDWVRPAPWRDIDRFLEVRQWAREETDDPDYDKD